jgi:glycosyltransferase involved in cell wall biosynthesis
VVSSLVPDGLDELARRAPRPDWLPRRPYLLFVGALGPHKGVDVLFAAYRRLVAGWRGSEPPPDLVCIGTARPDTPEVPHGVRIRHDVPHPQVMAAWHGAAIGIVPSIMEAMGQVAVEALLARTPLIASATGGLADMIRDGESGLLVPPGDAVALHAAILRLLTEPGLAERLRTAGHRRGLDYTAARVVPQIEEVYRACVASVRPAAGSAARQAARPAAGPAARQRARPAAGSAARPAARSGAESPVRSSGGSAVGSVVQPTVPLSGRSSGP